LAMDRTKVRREVTATSEPTILVINVGSSTLKFAIFPQSGGDDPLLHGVVEYSVTEKERAAAALLEDLKRHPLFDSIHVVGHRLVHGGMKLRDPVRIDGDVRALLDEMIPLAPDHLPAELRAIDEVSRVIPSLAQIACFDTAFHRDMPVAAKMFGVPRRMYEAGVARYGFHGLSYEYVVDALRQRGELPARTIIAHLGNGASITAVLDGVSIDTSMGMTPSGGLVMGTRSGDLDPGVMLYLLRSRGFSVKELDDAVNRDGGLLGISETTSDVRELLAAGSTDSRAEDAISVFCYQAAKYIGAYSAVLGGIDALVFTGGIGEHSPEIRARICAKLEFLGLKIDTALNHENASTISTVESRVAVRTVETREEVMIARHVRALARILPSTQ
jgi:acetate kinase